MAQRLFQKRLVANGLAILSLFFCVNNILIAVKVRMWLDRKYKNTVIIWTIPNERLRIG